MMPVTCPSCGEKGKLPSHLMSVRIKCKACNQSFIPNAPAGQPVAAPAGVNAAAVASALADKVAPRVPGGIEVEGLDHSSWVVQPEPEAPSAPALAPPPAPAEGQQPHPSETPFAAASRKQYKVLSSKDPYFKNQFDIQTLENALNHYAEQGWVVRSMATPHLAAFSGGPKEELLILLER